MIKSDLEHDLLPVGRHAGEREKLRAERIRVFVGVRLDVIVITVPFHLDIIRGHFPYCFPFIFFLFCNFWKMKIQKSYTHLLVVNTLIS